MKATALVTDDSELLKACLSAIASGLVFEEWEMHSLLGLERAELQALAAAWPEVDLGDEAVRSALANSLLNLLHYPFPAARELEIWKAIGVQKDRVRMIARRLPWLVSPGSDSA